MIKIKKEILSNLCYQKKISFCGLPIVRINRDGFTKVFYFLGIRFTRYLWKEEILFKLNNDLKMQKLETELQSLKFAMDEKFADLSEKIRFAGKVLKSAKEIVLGVDDVICKGFYAKEQWGRWLQPSASIILLPTDYSHDIKLHFDFIKLSVNDKKAKTITVYINKRKILTTESPEFDVTISKLDISNEGFLRIDFISTGGSCPKELGINDDERVLSFGLKRIVSDTNMIVGGFDYDLCKFMFEKQQNCVFKNEEWNKYLAADDIEIKKQALEQNLDVDSITLIRVLISRRQNPYEFSAYECEQYNKCRENKIDYQIANKQGFQPEVFYFRNGLKFVEPKIIENYLKDRDVIDGGACSGDSALMFSEYDFVHKVYAFEPVKTSYEGLKKTLEINNCEKAEAIHKGLGDRCATAEIMGENSEIITVDEFAKDKKIGCIKFDLEGMESQALQGCMETIKRDKPLLLICIYHTPKDFFEIKPMLEALNLGYRFKVVDTEPKNSFVGMHLMLIAY